MLLSFDWVFQSAALQELGEHTRALEAAQHGIRRSRDGAMTYVTIVRALAALGRVDELETQLAQGPRFSPPSRYRGKHRWYLPHFPDLEAIRELRAHRHEAAARRLLATVLDDLETHQDTARAAVRYVHGELLYEAGRWEEARTVFSRLIAEVSRDSQRIGFSIDIASRSYLGTIAARLGNRALAGRISAELDALRGPYLFGRHTFGRARIAAVLGEREQAVRLLRTAFAQGHPYRYATVSHERPHAHPDFATLRDYPPFQQLMEPKN